LDVCTEMHDVCKMYESPTGSQKWKFHYNSSTPEHGLEVGGEGAGRAGGCVFARAPRQRLGCCRESLSL
jgi:hypothetical protein